MRSVITDRQVTRQLAAMACDSFDIGILRQDGRMLLREAWTPSQIEQAIHEPRRENARGAHIFVRQNGVHALSLGGSVLLVAIGILSSAAKRAAEGRR